MQRIISLLESWANRKPTSEYILQSNTLKTKIHCFSELCDSHLEGLVDAFNPLFTKSSPFLKEINLTISDDENAFGLAVKMLDDDDFITTEAIERFNAMTVSSSKAKYTPEKRYCIMKCYRYFVYIFDTQEQKGYMLISDEKKALTMVNILLLTPYLLTGELYAVHGGMVSKNGKNVIISNSSLGGKTTFALLFATHGWNIITEENTYITSDGEILSYNIRNYFNIRVGTYLAFKDYFLSKGIVNPYFLKKKHLSNDELFDLGKDNQLSVYFDELGSSYTIGGSSITNFIKVSIDKNTVFSVRQEDKSVAVDAFLDISSAPTVRMFEELLGIPFIENEKKRSSLSALFENVKCLSVCSGFDYNENFDSILKTL